MLTYERAIALFTLLPTGRLVRRTGRCKGLVIGTINSGGYVKFAIDGKQYKAHRVVWLIVHGRWPEDQIDHINGVRHDNRPENLRAADHSTNQQNLARKANNTSGARGVSFHKGTCKWQAQIKCRGKKYFLGVHDTIEEAESVYLARKAELHVDSHR